MLKRLILNDVVEEVGSGIQYKLVYIDLLRDKYVFVQMNISRLAVTSLEFEMVNEMLEDSRLVLRVVESPILIKSEEDMSEAVRITLDVRWKAISRLLEIAPEPSIFSSKYRAQAIAQVEKEGLAKKSVLYNYIRKYYQYGKSKMALLPKYNNCGAQGQDRLTDVKVGRKRGLIHVNEYVKYEVKGNGVGINEDHMKRINTTIKRHLMGNTGITYAKAYRLMLHEFYEVENDWGIMVPLPNHELPSYRQFYYQLNKIKRKDYTKFMTKELGEKNFNLTARAGQSNTVVDALMPGFRYQIDSTKPNIIMLDKQRKNVIGTPVVFYVVDTFTKMIVGISVGLDASGWNGASSALLNVVEDKVAFAKRYDIDIRPDEWINTTLPQNILADKGEFAGSLPLGLIEIIGVSIENTPSGRGDLKGDVEKMFHLTEQELYGIVSGFSKKNYRQRGETDTNKKSRLTLYEVTQAYIAYTLMHNKKIMKKYPATQAMLVDKIELSPNGIWEWCVENTGVYQVNTPMDIVKYAVMREGDAVLTRKGIRLNGIHYESDLAIKEGWFTRAKALGVEKLKAKYDERDLNQIYILDKQSNVISVLRQTEDSKMQFENISYSEKAYYDAMKEISRLERIDEQIFNKNEFYQRIIKLNKLAKKLFVESNGKDKPNAQEKRVNRQKENALERPTQAIVINDDHDFMASEKALVQVDTKTTYKQKRRSNMSNQINQARKTI